MSAAHALTLLCVTFTGSATGSQTSCRCLGRDEQCRPRESSFIFPAHGLDQSGLTDLLKAAEEAVDVVPEYGVESVQ